jgi:hypothetical protein
VTDPAKSKSVWAYSADECVRYCRPDSAVLRGIARKMRRHEILPEKWRIVPSFPEKAELAKPAADALAATTQPSKRVVHIGNQPPTTCQPNSTNDRQMWACKLERVEMLSALEKLENVVGKNKPSKLPSIENINN